MEGSSSPPVHVETAARASERSSPDPDHSELTCERLIAVRPSAPCLRAGSVERSARLDCTAETREAEPPWRERSARLHRTIETLERVSAALCVTRERPRALCEALVAGAGHHLGGRWAAMTLSHGLLAEELPPVIAHYGGRLVCGWDHAPPELDALAARAVTARHPVVSPPHGWREREAGSGGPGAAVAVPIPVRDELAGAFAVGLPANARFEESDLSILLTLANHAGLALHNAWTFQESERLREHAAAAVRAAERQAAELERRSRQFERARASLEDLGRRQLLGQERNRIARELHDSVAQHLLSIGLMLEWCRKQEPRGSAMLERLVTSKELARSALEEIRTVIYELSSAEHPADLPDVLQEVVRELTHTTDLEISLRISGRPRAIPPAAAHALSQIAREALFNAVRHAEATRAWVTVRYDYRSIAVTIGDDGRGDPERLQRRLERAAGDGSDYHRGLANIAERARELAARVRFGHRRGGGVSLQVTAPLEPPPLMDRA